MACILFSMVTQHIFSSNEDFFIKTVQGKFPKAKKKICEFTVTRPTLIFGPDPKGFYCTFKRQLFQIYHFRFHAMFSTCNGSFIVAIKEQF